MISIVTPTYNRAYILPELYKSLLNQTCKEFEWIVIDDFSGDNTKELISGWLDNGNSFDIVYFRREENGGKHRALNFAMKVVKYDWFMILDSDDFLVNDAVETVHKWIKTVEHDSSFAAVHGLAAYISTGEIIGNHPADAAFSGYVDATYIEREKYNITGDKCEVFKTDVFRQYPFPEFDGETFMTESVVFNEIAHDGYKIRYFNKVLLKKEYLDDGLIKSLDRHFAGSFEGFTYSIRRETEILDKRGRRKAIKRYLRISKMKGLSAHEALKKINVSKFSYFAIIVRAKTKKLKSKIYNTLHH